VGQVGEGATWAVSGEVGYFTDSSLLCWCVAGTLFIFHFLLIYLRNILHIKKNLPKIMGPPLVDPVSYQLCLKSNAYSRSIFSSQGSGKHHTIPYEQHGR
jgi:hypothetical protein